MPMLKDSSKKYTKFAPLHIEKRQWPSRTIDKPPRWLSTDLRDGNQSLADPMTGDQKWKFFAMLVELGFKEIEVSFPSASQVDFEFTRRLVQTPGAVPNDVWLQVLSPCRKEFIQRTVESVRGAKKALLHIYLSTSNFFQRTVLGLSEEEALDLVVSSTQYARSITKDDSSQSDTEWAFEFSPEFFSGSDQDFVIRLCEAVKKAWEPTEQNPIIFNLPATVEMSSPNVYADQIESFCNRITERNKVCISVHPHNDRGCAVAAAELAQMAGADRVEGCLFGNGERTGNVDLVTLALNLYTQGINPNLDFSNINQVIDVVEECNKIPVYARTPYGGSLVVCAFSGSHQDAIKKGFQARQKNEMTDDQPWEIPYLPLDPQDIGRNYEAVIRVNSQSGKGGAAWIILRNLELDLPRALQIEFGKIVQVQADKVGREMLSIEIQSLFEKTYFIRETPRLKMIDYSVTSDKLSSTAPQIAGRAVDTTNSMRIFQGVISIDEREVHLNGKGNGPISSLANALSSIGIDLVIADYKEHAIGKGTNVKAASYIECTAKDMQEKFWGVGIHVDVVQSSLIALLSAASRYLKSNPEVQLILN